MLEKSADCPKTLTTQKRPNTPTGQFDDNNAGILGIFLQIGVCVFEHLHICVCELVHFHVSLICLCLMHSSKLLCGHVQAKAGLVLPLIGQTTALSNSRFRGFKHCTVVGIRADQAAAQRTMRLTVTSKHHGLSSNCLVKMITAKRGSGTAAARPCTRRGRAAGSWLHATVTGPTKTCRMKKLIKVYRKVWLHERVVYLILHW